MICRLIGPIDGAGDGNGIRITADGPCFIQQRFIGKVQPNGLWQKALLLRSTALHEAKKAPAFLAEKSETD